VAGTASAGTTAPVKAHTTLSIVAARNKIKAGQKDAVGGTLLAGKTPLAGKIIILDRVEGKKLVPVQDGLTGKAGRVRFIVAPKTTAKYELVFLGTKKLAATHSGVVTIIVK